MDYKDQKRYDKAHKKVKELKGFYIHLMVFIVMNAFMLVNIYISKSYKNENFWEFESFFTLFAWGIGILIHGLSVRKIKKIMDQE